LGRGNTKPQAPAFAEAASRRQAKFQSLKKHQSPNFQNGSVIRNWRLNYFKNNFLSPRRERIEVRGRAKVLTKDPGKPIPFLSFLFPAPVY
jgi:hypothetical protein